jgi:IS30 family transposase
VTPDVLISERPAEANDRAVAGHWEGDLIIGAERSAIATLVDRSTRFTMLVHLPRERGRRESARMKNGPALSGYGATSMNKALAAALAKLPGQMVKSLTWDRGKEMSAHAALTSQTGVAVFFADPHSPWQRGTNENTNGLLHRYFPKGTDLSRWSKRDLAAVADSTNTPPRKVLAWRTPAEAMEQHLQSLQKRNVASTS